MAIDAGYTITPLSGSGIQIQYSVDGSTWHATFTDGDVYMRQKVDGGEWTDAIKIVGEDGKNAIAMTSATTPSGEYEGQVGIWQNQIYFWTNGAWVNQTPELPTDAVLHYSFDEVPDYPDGTADYFKNKDWKTPSGWTSDNNNTTYSVTGGVAKWVTSSSTDCQLSNTIANSAGKLFVINCKTSVSACRYSFIGMEGSSYKAFGSGVITEGWNKLSFLIPSTFGNKIILQFQTGSSDVSVEIAQLYIGNGSYTTPIIDNANGQWNSTSQGCVAVQGVSGKGVNTFNKYILAGTKNLTDDFAISIWVNPSNNTNGLVGNIINKNLQFILRNGAPWGNYLMLYLYQDGVGDPRLIGTLLPPNVWTHLVINKSGTTLNVFRNGVITHSFTLSSSAIDKNTNAFMVGTSNNTRPQSYDDLLVFDRALSDKEVLALYQNKANTPKYYDLSDYSIEQIDDDNVVDHLTEKPQLLSKWLEIYNAKNVSSALPTSTVSTNGEYKGVINTANEVGVISTTELTNYIQATNALRSALWGTNGYLVDMNTDSTLNGNLDTLFANYRETLQIARTQISQQQASQASALAVVNSNPFQLLPCNTNNHVTSYDNTGTRLQVFNGVTELQAVSSGTLSEGQFKVTVSTDGKIIAGTAQTVPSGQKYIEFGNVSNMDDSVTSAVVTYQIEVLCNGTPNTLWVTQKFGKSKEGADGRIYSLLPDFTAVKKSADGSVLTPSSVTVQAKSWTGSSIPEPYSQGDLVALENGQQIASESLEHSITFNPTGNYPVVVNLYRHGTNTLIDTVTIPILQEVKGDTGRGLQSETSYYKLSANLTETFDSTTISTWTDSADSTPTAQKPYLHCAVLSEYTEAPTNVYGDDVIIREYVTNGTNGTSTRYSSASATSSTTTIALNTITGNTAVVGDVIIANSLLFVVTAVGSTNATVQYKQSIKGADNKSVTVLLSNQNPNVTSNSDGSSPVLTNTLTNVRVYENTIELKYDASSTANGYYKITVTATGCTHSSITDKGDYAQVNAISAMSADSATRNLAISGKRSDGTSFSFNVVQTITKLKKGNPTTISETEIKYFQNQNGTVEPSDSENWSDTPPSQIAGYYLWTRTKVTYSDETVVKSYSVTRNGSNGSNGTSTRYSTASVTSSTESIALSTITGGTAVVGDVVIAGSMIFSVTAVSSTNATVQYKASIKGEDNKSITVILSTPNVNVSCDSSGTPTGYTNTPTTIRVYQNTQELSYDGSGTSNGTWKATVSRSGCTGGSFTDSGVYATLGAITGMSSDNASRTITITGKRTDGTSFTTTVTQTLSKNKQGQAGQNAQFVEITAPDGLIFLNGLPDTLNLIAETTEITSPIYKWYKKNQNNISWNILPETSNTLSVSAVGVYKVVVNDSWTDFATVTAVSENYVSSLSNENFSVITDPNLVVIDTVTRTIELKAFLGSTPHIPTTNGSGTPASGYFRYSVSGNNQKFTIATQNDKINRKGIISITPIENAVISSEIITVTIKYDNGLTETKTISITATIKGNTGNTGVSMRHKGNWESGQSYVNNSDYIDVVYYTTNGCSYSCKQSHTASDSINPTNENYWNKIADKGKGVTSVIAYTALSTDTTKPAQSEFTTTAKSVDSTNRCLWRYEVTTYTDNSTTGSYADATIIGVWGNSGIDATSVSISSEQIEVMCGSGNGKFLGQQTQKITVYARKGSAKKACTLSFTSPASGTGITITKQNGTASADGYFNITFADNGNLGGDSTNSFDLSLTVTVDTVPFVFTVKAVKASKGVYLGRCASKPSSATVTVYTGDTWNESSATKYALKGDYVSVVNMTESDSNRGKMFQWNGSEWNEDGNTGHAMEALDDMLLMSDTLPDGSRATKFLDRLITNEVLAKRMTSLEVMFKEFVASFKGSNYESGDLSISMGKNPKNLYDDKLNFNIQSFLAMLPKSANSAEQSEMWRKEFYTENDDVYKKTDLITKGDISLGGTLKTFDTVYSGANVEEQPFIYPDSFTSNDTVVFSVRQDMLRMFRCSNGTIYVYIGVLPSIQDQLAFSLSYTWNGNINQIYDIYQTYTEGQGFTEYISTSEGVYRYKDTESERFSLVVDKVFFRMNPYKGKVICWDDASEESFLFDGTNLTQIDVIGDVFVEFTENLYVGYAKYSTNPIIEFYNCNEDGFNRVGYNNLQGKPIYNIDAYTHKRGNSAGSINKNNIYGLYAVNGKLYLSYDTTVTAGKACMILRSNDCGNTWDIISSVISTSSTSTNSSRFLFGYNKDGLIVLCGSGTYSYSTNNGEKFTIKTVALSSWKWIGRSIEDFGQNSRDILIPYWSSGLKFKKLINVNTAEIFKKNISNQKGNLIKFRNGDGFVIQWGQTENLGNASSGVTKTASISLNNRPFFNNNYSVFVTLEGSTSGLELAVKDKTRFGFTITGYNRNSGTPVNDVVFHWLAIGNTDK